MNHQRLSIPNKEKVSGKLVAEYLDQFDASQSDLVARVLRYSTFSRVQGYCLESIFNNWDNLLINAPTGSGKTHIFEVALLYQYLVYENKEKFKSVLIVPIKSLCSEVAATWTRIFSPLRVLELNSDFVQDRDEELDSIDQANILIMTPEKFSMIMKRPAELEPILAHLRLIIIDEMHILDDCERGPALESAITRLKMIQAKNAFKLNDKSIRLVCASATFNNGSEICRWLGVPKGNFLQFSEDFRPVQLTNYVFGYPNAASAYHFDIALNYKVNDIISKFSYGKNCLVFCPTQKSAQKTAEDIIKYGEQRQFIKSEMHLQELSKGCTSIKDQALRNCLINGVGFHSAGLDPQSRREVERLFRDNQLLVLCTTSTLAQGVNLPAHLVVIKGTKTYRGNTKGFEEYKYQDIIQMVGRAGRPQFDTSGVCVIMTDFEMVSHYEQIKNQSIEINSHYLKNIRDDIGAEIALGSVSTADCAIMFVQKSFFFVRYTSGKQKMEILKTISAQKMSSNLGAFVRTYVEKCLEELVQLNLVKKEGDLYTSTHSLREICKQCIGIDTLAEVLKNPADMLMTKESLLNLLSLSNEFSRITSKVNERKELNELNKFIGMPLKKSACTFDRKVWVLLQVYIQKLKIVNWDLKVQANEIANISTRILKCYFKIYLDKKNFHCVMVVYDLLLSIKRRIHECDLVQMLKQIGEINDSMAKDLISQHHIRSLSQLRLTDPSIFSSLSKRPQSPETLLRCLPDLNLVVRLSKKGTKTIGRIYIKQLSPPCGCMPHLFYTFIFCQGPTVVLHRHVNLKSLGSKQSEIKGAKSGALSGKDPLIGNSGEALGKGLNSKPSVDFFVIEVTLISLPAKFVLLSDFYVGCTYEVNIDSNVDERGRVEDWGSQFRLHKNSATAGLAGRAGGGPSMVTRITEYFGKTAQQVLPESDRKQFALKQEDKKQQVAQNMLLNTFKKIDKHRSDMKTTATRHQSSTTNSSFRNYNSDENLDFNRELEELVAEFDQEQKVSVCRDQISKEKFQASKSDYDIEKNLVDKLKPKKRKLSKRPLANMSVVENKENLLEALIKGRPDLENSLRDPLMHANPEPSGKYFMLPIPKPTKSAFSFSRYTLNFD